MTEQRQELRPLWSTVERKCMHLLQQRNSQSSLLQIHAFMLRYALETNVNLLTKFILTCASSSHVSSRSLIRYARRVFDHRPYKEDPFLCNSMIKFHVGMHQFAESFNLYRHLRRETGFVPNDYTFVPLIKSCGSVLAIKEGEEIHTHAFKYGFCNNLFVSTALVDMYVKFGKMGHANKVFDEMTEINKVSLTALMVGFARVGDMTNARKLFDQMEDKDSAAYNAMIDGYIKLGDMSSANELFDQMQDKNVISWTSMIWGFCHNSDIESARSLFDAMPEKNIVSWNAMISGYCQNKKPHEALKLFHKMQATTSFEPDDVTVVSILPAIADLGAMDLGGRIHSFIRRKNLDKVPKICNALIDMYAKCGEITNAKKVFDAIPEKETASWNALINGYAVNGCAEEALDAFSVMIREKVKPNEITMLAVLSACNHCGLVEEGKKLFNAMEDFGLILQVEHYGCMVDLLGRAGCLEEAEKMIKSMPYEVNGIILSSFLSSCSYFKDVKRAERVRKEAAKSEHWNDENYVMLRNLYASEKRWGDVDEVKSLMKKSGVNKEVGMSAIEVDGRVREFMAGNFLHPFFGGIKLMLGQLMNHMKVEAI